MVANIGHKTELKKIREIKKKMFRPNGESVCRHDGFISHTLVLSHSAWSTGHWKCSSS